MKYYTLQAIKSLIDRYIDQDGQVTEVKKGVLGYGTTILHGAKLKTAIIQEHYLNEWSSGHTVRFYNITPAKYLAKLGV